MKKKLMATILLTASLALLLSVFGGCSSDSDEEVTTDTPAEEQYAESIMVYCGAGMRKPMDDIGLAFQEKYGTQVTFNYGGSNALLSQMELTEAGDAYMPGAAMYLEVAEEKGLVDYQQIICYHIPIITVPKGNPAGITSLEDMGKPGVTLVWGDPEVAAIGKTGKQMLEKLGLYDAVWPNVVATLPTMNEVMLQISLGQADASLNWWDTVKFVDDIDLIEIPIEQNDIKTIPIATTTFSNEPETARLFVDFCASDEGKAIFEQHGFTVYPDARYGD